MSHIGDDHRDGKGRFRPGNPGGPGRPVRRIERDYLAALSDVLTLEDWAEICRAAVVAAKQGDAKARDWLTKHCIGQQPPSLKDLAAKEARGFSSEDEIALDCETDEHFERVHEQNLKHFE